LIRQIKNELEQIAYSNAVKFTNATTTGRITLMCNENEKLEEFIKAITSIKDEKKKGKALSDLFEKKNNGEFSLDDAKNYLQEKYKKTSTGATFKELLSIDEIYKTYVKAFLNQAKYNLRKEKEVCKR